MTVDAYATALVTMNLEELSNFLSNHSELKVYIIFEMKIRIRI